ncbi:YfiR family protein [Paraglaciecola sp. 2405UD69-4]|uniref:YfiR family protein n=1 Tax=Paraglaciecola sp. 2405UD69-4 TaxID=3391836 RepID=UPI0039C9BCF6
MRTLILTFLLLVFSHNGFANDQVSKLDKLKAAYMFNFVKFITWPADNTNEVEATQSNNSEPLTFCLQTSAEFKGFFEALANTQVIGPQQKSIKSILLEEAVECDLVYLTAKYDDAYSKLSRAVVIQNSELVESRLSVFTFFKQNNRLRFEIDLQRAKQLKIDISSELLKLAKVKQ